MSAARIPPSCSVGPMHLEAGMPGRRLVAALAILALTATACHGPSRSGKASSRPSASTSAPGPAPAPAAPSYSAGRSQPVADPVYPDFGNPAIDEIRLDFARPLRADSVTVDGRAARATHRGNDLIIGAGQRLARDARVDVAVRYHGRPASLPGPMVRKDISAVGFHVRPDGSVFALQEPYGALTWYPVNDQPSDEALYDVALTVPRGWAGVSNGVLRSTSGGGGKVTYSWHAADPMASYLVALGIDRYQKHRATGPHGLPVSYWIRPGDRDWAFPLLRKTPQMLAWLEKRFGGIPKPRSWWACAGWTASCAGTMARPATTSPATSLRRTCTFRQR